jgi:hypothetical protein
MRFARWLFLISGIWGILLLFPHYFMEQTISEKLPPAITHPEYYYGFIGVGLAWQIAFLIIATDPVRFRPMMVPCGIEKLSFAAATIALYMAGRAPLSVLGGGLVDLVFGALFLVAWWLIGTRRS